jgi:CO/xanthine dehydrogenase FAD-binding subunit
MVEVNFAERRPPALLDLSHLSEPKDWYRRNGTIELGAGVTYTRIINELGAELPALAIASRTVGSPQIRNRGTVGGNLATASPAGDAHPPLLATGATVRAESMRGVRDIPIGGFFLGPKRSALEPDELIRSVSVPVARGPQQFSKVGTRNAMVIAVVSFAIALDLDRRSVGTGIGSAGPTPLEASEAAGYLEGELAEGGYWEEPRALPPGVVDRFSEMVASAASPIDDVRGAARYRTHALRVMSGRTLTWAWEAAGEGRPA